METVKVDLQKLQLLNDRIAQTIDALHQVRLTVHGIQHSNPAGYGGFQQFGQPQQQWGQPQQQWGQPQQQWGQPTPFGFQGPMGITPIPMQGIQHSNPYQQNPYQQNPYQQQFGYLPQPFIVPQQMGGIAHSNPQLNPWNQQLNQLGQFGQFGQGFGQSVDPYWQMRVAQTFPFVGSY
jgi:hypothetical protein